LSKLDECCLLKLSWLKVNVTYPPSDRLQRFIDSAAIKNDPFLKNLLLQADELQEASIIIHNLVKLTNEYVGVYLETLTGLTQADIISGGMPALTGLCDPHDVNQLSSSMASYIIQAKSPYFDPRSFILHSYSWKFNHRLGYKVPSRSMGVVLTFTPHGDLEYGVGFVLKADAPDSKLEECKLMLLKIKDRHNEMYVHPVRQESLSPYPLNYLINVEHITIREREVLGWLAKGKSTHEIAITLGITENTIETHRKNLLEKFDAKNVAELIKKASKVFWLE
jgi:DNA-binding CsgD family transcriptional regulator